MKAIVFVARALWAVAASILWIVALLFVPLLGFATLAARWMRPGLFEAAILVALLGWGVLVAKVSESDSRIGVALKEAHRRFIYPFGED
jgi:hypothetical protein